MLSKNEIIDLLSDEKNQNELFTKADEIRRQYVGDEVHLRGLMEFSNICRNNCLYCGIRRENSQLKRYRMSPEEIIQTAKQAANIGFKTIVMQSGEDLHFSNDVMCDILREIKKFDVAITLSLGERDYEDYKLWKEAGANVVMPNITSNEYKSLYTLYPNKTNVDKAQSNTDIVAKITAIGRTIGNGYGEHKKKNVRLNYA